MKTFILGTKSGHKISLLFLRHTTVVLKSLKRNKGVCGQIIGYGL